MNILKKLTQGRIVAGLAEKSPEVLMGSAFGLMVIACFVTHRQTLKADEALRKEKERIAKEKDIPVEEVTMEKADEFRVVAPYYVGTVLCIAGGGTLLYFSAKESQRKLAAATAAYMVSEEKFVALEEKAKDILGLKKEEEAVREEIQKNPPTESNSCIAKVKAEKDARYVDENGNDSNIVKYIGTGDVTFYDVLSTQYIISDILSMKNAFVELNAELQDALEINMNDYLYAIGGRPMDQEVAEQIVWDNRDGLLNVTLMPVIEDGKLFVRIIHHNKPKNRGDLF